VSADNIMLTLHDNIPLHVKTISLYMPWQYLLICYDNILVCHDDNVFLCQQHHLFTNGKIVNATYRDLYRVVLSNLLSSSLNDVNVVLNYSCKYPFVYVLTLSFQSTISILWISPRPAIPDQCLCTIGI
jgi:hypothetical protein